jgi:hypothetical protein
MVLLRLELEKVLKLEKRRVKRDRGLRRISRGGTLRIRSCHVDVVE